MASYASEEQVAQVTDSDPDLFFAPVVRPRPPVAEPVVAEQAPDVLDSCGLVGQLDQIPVEFGAPYLQRPRYFHREAGPEDRGGCSGAGGHFHDDLAGPQLPVPLRWRENPAGIDSRPAERIRQSGAAGLDPEEGIVADDARAGDRMQGIGSERNRSRIPGRTVQAGRSDVPLPVVTDAGTAQRRCESAADCVRPVVTGPTPGGEAADVADEQCPVAG